MTTPENLIGGGMFLAGSQAPPPPPGASGALAITGTATGFASPPGPGTGSATGPLAITGTATGTSAPPPPPPGGIPAFDHIVLVMMENHGYSQIIGSSNAPYINSLVPSSALFTDSHGGPDVLHPSFPNYMQAFSGATQGVTTDTCPPPGQPYFAANMASSLIAAGKTFGGYAESQPSGLPACGPSPFAGRHVPWLWFANVPKATWLNFSAFPTTTAGYGSLPTVSWVIPDLSHDMHSFGTETDAQTIQAGDTWLKTHLDPYLQWARTHNSLLIIQFDEDNFTTADHIPTMFCGAQVKAGLYGEHITHYNILATVEKAYGAALSGGAATATPITDCWAGGTNFASNPSAFGYPDATNTGATGTLTQLTAGTPSSGTGWSWDGSTLTITGAITFANFQIPGSVVVSAAAIMRNCKVITSGFNSNGITVGANGYLIDHCTIQGTDALSGGLDAGIKTSGGSRAFSGTIDSCNIFNARSGCQDLAGTVQNTYIHDLRHATGDHINGLTQNGGTSPTLTVQHCTIFNPYDQTDAVGLFGDFGQEGGDTITDNILAGGGYTIYGGNTSPGGNPVNVVITNNRISNKYFAQGGFFGWLAAQGTGSSNVVSGNVWDATGALIPGQ